MGEMRKGNGPYERTKERYVIVRPDQMEQVSKKEGFLRFQFENSTGKWQNHFPLKNPNTRSGLKGEYPVTRAVFEVK